MNSGIGDGPAVQESVGFQEAIDTLSISSGHVANHIQIMKYVNDLPHEAPQLVEARRLVGRRLRL
jgi:hypothetical protein